MPALVNSTTVKAYSKTYRAVGLTDLEAVKIHLHCSSICAKCFMPLTKHDRWMSLAKRYPSGCVAKRITSHIQQAEEAEFLAQMNYNGGN